MFTYSTPSSRAKAKEEAKKVEEEWIRCHKAGIPYIPPPEKYDWIWRIVAWVFVIISMGSIAKCLP